jgi:hypothetical protein
MIMLKQVNEYLASMPHDTMNDYYPPALWLDTDTGTYGDAKRLVIIDVSQWGDDEIGVWETMTDSEPNDKATALTILMHSDHTATRRSLNRRPPRQNICGR